MPGEVVQADKRWPVLRTTSHSAQRLNTKPRPTQPGMDYQRLDALNTDDWSLIALALAEWAGNPNEFETTAERRAYFLLETIAAANGCTPGELVRRYPVSDSPPGDGPE